MSARWEGLLEQLVQERWSTLLARATLLAATPSDAEDLVQDALVATFSSRARFTTLAQAESYVRRAIATRSIDRARTRGQRATGHRPGRRCTRSTPVETTLPGLERGRPCRARAAHPAAARVRRAAAPRGPLGRADRRAARAQPGRRQAVHVRRRRPRCSAGSAPPRTPGPTTTSVRPSSWSTVARRRGTGHERPRTAAGRHRDRRGTRPGRGRPRAPGAAGRDRAAGAAAPGRPALRHSRWPASRWSVCSVPRRGSARTPRTRPAPAATTTPDREPHADDVAHARSGRSRSARRSTSAPRCPWPTASIESSTAGWMLVTDSQTRSGVDPYDRHAGRLPHAGSMLVSPAGERHPVLEVVSDRIMVGAFWWTAGQPMVLAPRAWTAPAAEPAGR